MISGMWILLLPLLAQVPTDRALLDAEHSRQAGASALRAAASSRAPRVQRAAARGLGRLEDPANADVVLPLLRVADPVVRQEAANALAQMQAPADYGAILSAERDAGVRAVLLASVGRVRPAAANAESLLAAALADPDARVRTGALRGLESLLRLNARTLRAAPSTVDALRAALHASHDAVSRQLAVLALRAGGVRDSASYADALRDSSAQVRRVAVAAARVWMVDPSPLVRLEALRVAGSCERAQSLLTDSSEHVALAAIDALGTLKCASAPLQRVMTEGGSWRARSHALVALAQLDPASARAALPGFAKDETWQVRARAAAAAQTIGDSATLAVLARDSNPNVAIAAMRTVDDAIRALRSDHSGLVLAGAERLKGTAELPTALARLTSAFLRLTRDGAMTVRDPRAAVLARIGEVPETTTNTLLRDALSDRDPAIAAQAAALLSARTGARVAPETTRLPIPPLPSDAYLAGLRGATARITLRGRGVLVAALFADDAPVTTATFAQLAEAGRFNGLTFHRIVANFVVQGASPGADEFDALTREFMRDEVGLRSHARGTLGISTRGRDTGDGQIFLNLVDNYRLDHDYTVFGEVRTVDLPVMDGIEEGDVIERIEIIRRTAAPRRR